MSHDGADGSEETVLEVKNIVMQFPAVLALDDVSIQFQKGEVHGIIGENGAGKSTLMKILSGVQAPTSGAVIVGGKSTTFTGVRDAQSRGIAMIHQELNLVDELTVFENVFLGRELVSRGVFNRGVLNRSQMILETDQALKQVGAAFPATANVGELSVAAKQLVEIAKATAVKASILIMDEPTAVLSDPESESLFALIERLKAQGVTVLYISHRLAEVSRICDRITVMRDGRTVETRSARNANPNELAGLMVGRALGDFYPPKNHAITAAPRMEVKNVRGATFSVHPGEILGIAGLVGAGRTELAETVFGARGGGGEISVNGNTTRVRNPKDAMKAGIAYVSEDRKGLGLHTALSSTWNITLANLKSYAKVAIQKKKEQDSAVSWKRRLDIRANDLDAPVATLSGGNQQKISIAKWLETQPQVLILDEPTRGVDVGAKREIYDQIQKLASDGMACVLISSELPEIIGLCHRAVVMREGRIVGELGAAELSEEAVMRLAAGVATP